MKTDDIMALAGALQKNARTTDEQGLSAETIEQLASLSLLDAASPAEVMERARLVALGCGASAWMVTQFATGAALLALANEAVRQTVGTQRVLHLGPLDEAKLEIEKGQAYLTGQLGAVAGLDHAEWLAVSELQVDGQPAVALIRKTDVQEAELEHRGGLRGLKWRSISSDRALVHLIRLEAKQAYHWRETVVLLGAVMGAAQAGYDDYVNTTRARITGIGGQSVAQFTQVQARLSESHAELKAIRGLYDTVVDQVEALEADHPECVRDRVYIARKGVEAVNRLLVQMGAMGLSEVNPVQRRYRDLRALACVRGLDWIEQMPIFGKYELGLISAGEAQGAA